MTISVEKLPGAYAITCTPNCACMQCNSVSINKLQDQSTAVTFGMANNTGYNTSSNNSDTDTFIRSAQNIRQIANQSDASLNRYRNASNRNLRDFMLLALQANVNPVQIAAAVMELYRQQQDAMRPVVYANGVMRATADDVFTQFGPGHNGLS